MLKDNPFIKGLSSVCTGEEGKEGRGKKQWAKGKLSDLLKGTRSLQDQHGWAQHWTPALGLCAKKMPSPRIRKTYVDIRRQSTVFPSRQRKGQWWLLALAALRAQSWTNLLRTGRAENPSFFLVENTERERFPVKGLSPWWRHKQCLVQSWQIPARKPGWISLGVLSRKKERKEWLFPAMASLHSWKGRSRAVPSLHCAPGPSSGVWVVQTWLLRLKESWGCSKADRDSLGSLSFAFPSAVPSASSRQTDRHAD